MDNSDDVLKIKYLDENGIVMFYSRLNNRYKIVDSLPDIETVSPVDRHKLFILKEIGTAGARYWPFVIEQDGWHNISVTKSDIDGKYEKPGGGIPESDLAADVQVALGKADTAVQPNSLSTVASTGNYEDLNNKPELFSGDYNDLSNKPTIPVVDQSYNASSGNAQSGTAVAGALADVRQVPPAQSTDTGKILGVTDAAGTVGWVSPQAASQVNSDWNATEGVAAILNKPNLAAVATSGSYNDLADKPNIPSFTQSQEAAINSGVNSTKVNAYDGHVSDSDIHVTTQDKAAWDGKQDVIGDLESIRSGAAAGATAYQKPSGGIPSTDLSSAVQDSLGKADTAIQSHQDISGKADKVTSATSGNFAALDASGNLTDSGNKAADFATSAQGALADSAYQLPAGGMPSTDMSYETQVSLGKADSAYQKPSGGIPDTDLSSGVQASLAKADTALQQHQDISGKVDKISGGTAGNLVALDNTGGISDSGKSLSDLQMKLTAGANITIDPNTNTISAVGGGGGGTTEYTAGPGIIISGTAISVNAGSNLSIDPTTGVISATDTTYESKSASESGTDVSLVTTGEKYNWNAKYDKPSGGIPKGDLASGVQNSLDLADSALQSHQDISGKADKAEMSVVPGTGNDADKTTITLKSGTSATVLTSHQDISGKQDVISDLDTIRAGAADGATAYQKPSGGIPDTDLSSSVQTSLGKADTALQSHQDISGKADKVSSATNGNFAGLDSNGNLTDSGSKAADFATAAQGILADSAYQKPSGGIPDTDLSSDVQASLGKADTALQSHQDISGKADKVSEATSGNFAALDGNGNLVDSGSKASDFATAAQGTKADSAVQPGDLATVATSGSYSDLSNKPSIPTVDQSYSSSSTNAQSGTAVANAISGKQDTLAFDGTYDASDNKVATVSTVTNAVSEKANKSEMSVTAGTGTDADKTTIQLKTGLTATVLTAHQDISGKQDTISDLQTIREGASAGATAYQKPSGGIPDTDLSSSVQTSLGKADTALQSHQDISGKADKVSGATNGNFAGLDSNGNLTDSGSKAGDFATAAQGGKADTAVQPGDLATVATSGSYTDLSNTPDLSDYVLSSSLATVATSGSYADLSNTPDIPTVDQTYDGTSTNAQSGVAMASAISDKADKVSGATNGNFAGLDSNGNLTDSGSKAGDFATSAQGAKADSAYQKPSGGIPDTDLSSSVQASLGKADTALQSHQDISGKADKVSGATNGNFAGIDSNGNLTDSGSKASDFATAAQGTLADSAYQKPSRGIPDTDLSSGVQASLAKADTALQSHQDISGKADKVFSATNGNFAGLDSNGNLTDSGSKASDFATSAQGTKADSAIQSVKVNGSALTPDANKAVDITVPAAQVNSDWNSSSGLSEILNKPDLSVYALKSEMSVVAGTGTDADKTTITLKSGAAATVLTAHQDITGKQDVISDLSTIRSGAEAGATAYQKPSGGIPDTDLSSGVQASLGKADTALQSHQDISGKADKVSGATNGNFAGLDANGNLTDSGSKAGDFATAAQGAKADSAYQKPSGGIPDTDLSSGVQASLGKADTALQSHQDISGKADKVSGATNGNFAGLDSNGNLTDSGSKASDFATAAQGTLADSAYQLPSGGMPSTDMASAVQTSLGKADSSIQGVKVNSTALTPDTNHIVDITINNATVTIDMAGTASSPNRSVGSFTVDQSSDSTITIPAAVSAIPAVLDQNNEVVTAAVPAQPGVLSSDDKEKLDGLFNVTSSSTIAIDPSTHAVSAIVGPDGGVVAGANGLIVQPDLVSRVVYVGADCVYNDKTFWSDSTTVDGIIADYANQTVTDYRGNGVPLARFVAEYDSNRCRIANIDETPGTVEYNRKIGGQIIDLMRSDFWMSSHPTYDIIKFDKDMDELFDLLMTGSPMNAYLLLNNMTSTAFITDSRREMYMDMIKAYDAWPYADKDTAYADFMDEHALDRFVQVSTTWPLNSWNSYRYVMAGTKTATDKVIFVLRHAERGDDTSVNGDINSTGVTTCTTMGEQVRNNASWTSGSTTYRIDNFPANDATYYSTEYLRCKHSAQAFAEARYDTDFAASDYSGITVEADMLNQYRFFYQPAESGNSDLIRKYSVNPSQLTSSELSNYFGVSSAAEAQEKLSNDYVRVCKEILNKSTARLNMFYTHDFFTLPLAVMASNKYFDFSGNSSADNRNWINYCAGIGMVLHPDNTYEVMPVRGKSNGSMTI